MLAADTTRPGPARQKRRFLPHAKKAGKTASGRLSMQKKLIGLIIVIVIGFIASQQAVGCAVITVPSLEGFDASEYVFVGEVIGLSEPMRSDKFHGEAWGLKVKVKESLNLPKTTASYMVVFPFDLASDCKDEGQSKEKLLAYFPVGTEVRVIAKESTYFPSKMRDNNLRLQILPDNLGSIARNLSNLGKQVTSTSTIYDYESYVYRSPCGISHDERPGYESNGRLPEWEFRKELFRLRDSKSEAEKLKILKRMVYFPSSANDYFNVVLGSIRNKAAAKTLIQDRSAWSQQFLTRLVLSC
jgi:hypothetical protein